MMLSRVESGKGSGDDSSSGRLLREIEEISKALYLNKAPATSLISPSEHRSKSAGKTRLSQSKSRRVNEGLLHKDKKSSIWNWKPLKALTHIRNHRFYCCFFLHVHVIEGLPSNFNDHSLCVQWKRKDEVLRTRPAQVCQGMAEFEETLMHRCSVYFSRNGPHHSAKYEPKVFLLHASVIGAPGLDIGKHWIDLTRLLPLTTEELEEKRSSGKWTTGFKLAGKAKGAMLNVSFGFSVLGDNMFDSSSHVTVPGILKRGGPSTPDNFADFGLINRNGMLQRLGSVSRNSYRGSHLESQSLDMKRLDDALPTQGEELARSITFLYEKFDEGTFVNSEDLDFFYDNLELFQPKPGFSTKLAVENSGHGCENIEFTVIEHGVEFPVKECRELQRDADQSYYGSAIETIDVAEIFRGDGTASDEEAEYNSKDEVFGNDKDEGEVDGSGCKEKNACTKETTREELDLCLHNLSISESAVLDSSVVSRILEQEDDVMTKSSYKAGRIGKSYSLDDVTESVANEFLNMLGFEQGPLDIRSDTEPESPRACLLRQFENDAFTLGNSIFYFDARTEEVEVERSSAAPTGYRCGDNSDDFDLSLVIKVAEEEHDRVSQSSRNKRNAKMLENLETEALMQEWGLNEKDFQNSPRVSSSGGFGSPVYLTPEKPFKLPPLGEGVGPIVQTNGGGFLRSMNPSLFRYAKNGACLIMQVSAPVVLPAALGSDIMEILQRWTLIGAERMSMQVNDLMPLEDITGKKMQEVVLEAASGLEVLERWPLVLHESELEHDLFCVPKEVEEFSSVQSFDYQSSSSIRGEMDSDYVSLKDLVPLAMNKIEALSIEGLRIQSSMSDEEAPSSIRPQSIGKTSAFLDKGDKLRGSFRWEGATGLQQLDVNDVDELISLCLSLDEWMRVDAGIIGNADEINEKVSEILVAHHAKSVDLIRGKLTRNDEWGEPSGRRCGFLGNNFTVALKVQLRDPFRDYETVGASMLALFQVERVYVPLKPEAHSLLSESSYHGEEAALYEQLVENGINVQEKEKTLKEGRIPQFKITEVHVAGLNAEGGKKQFWGTIKQQESGSRWLLSSGMGNTEKPPFSKSSAIVKSSSSILKKVKPADILWSISADSTHVHSTDAGWKELATPILHTRNPDVVFLSETVRFP